jgi:hypothetical protein
MRTVAFEEPNQRDTMELALVDTGLVALPPACLVKDPIGRPGPRQS